MSDGEGDETGNIELKIDDPITLDDTSIRDHVIKYFNKSLTDEEIKRLGGSIGDWDVSQVTDMSELFLDRTEFNENLNSWNVENVTNMKKMFFDCTSFNNGENPMLLNVKNVKNMERMFLGCTSFNQPLYLVNVNVNTDEQGNNNYEFENLIVENMKGMFSGCTKFNNGEKPLILNVENVKNMRGMFNKCIEFNQPLISINKNKHTAEPWHVEKVEEMDSMFAYCTNFNNGGQPLNWNVENVENMGKMFYYCKGLTVPITFNNFNTECNTSLITQGIPDGNNLKISKNENKLLTNQQTATNPTGGRRTRKQKGKKVHYKKSRKMPL